MMNRKIYFLIPVLLCVLLYTSTMFVKKEVLQQNVIGRDQTVVRFTLSQEGLLLIPVTINSNIYRLIIDTGLTHTLIPPSAGGKPIARTYTITDTHGDLHEHRMVAIDELRIGDLAITNAYFPEGKHTLSSYDGILGMDILANYTLTFDFVEQTITFSNGGEASIANKIPITSRSGLPYVNLLINGENYEGLLDTGCDDFVLINSKDTPFPKTTYSTSWKGVDLYRGYNDHIKRNKQTLFTKSLVAITTGHITLENEIVTHLDRGTTSNLIGIDFLKRFERVTIDFKGGNLFLENKTHKSLLALQKSLLYFNGIGVVFSNDSIPKVIQVCTEIDSNSIAIGDQIVGMDHRLTVELDSIEGYRPIRTLFTSRSGSNGSSKFVDYLRYLRFGKQIDKLMVLRNGTIKDISVGRRSVIPIDTVYVDNISSVVVNNLPFIRPSTIMKSNKESDRMIFKL